MRIQTLTCPILLAGILVTADLRTATLADAGRSGDSFSTADEINKDRQIVQESRASEGLERAFVHSSPPARYPESPAGETSGGMLIGEPRPIWGLILGFLLIRARRGAHSP